MLKGKPVVGQRVNFIDNLLDWLEVNDYELDDDDDYYIGEGYTPYHIIEMIDHEIFGGKIVHINDYADTVLVNFKNENGDKYESWFDLEMLTNAEPTELEGDEL